MDHPHAALAQLHGVAVPALSAAEITQGALSGQDALCLEAVETMCVLLGRVAGNLALTLGARGWQIFWRVTLPNIKWGLLYGIILCNARAMGEFGAVSVVSGHIRGYTNTMPLHVELLYNNYDYVGAFAVSALLAMLALAAPRPVSRRRIMPTSPPKSKSLPRGPPRESRRSQAAARRPGSL